jgi:hypothetical protein
MPVSVLDDLLDRREIAARMRGSSMSAVIASGGLFQEPIY